MEWERQKRVWVAAFLLAFLPLAAGAGPRFPQPDFQGGHTLPVTLTPAPRAVALEYLDVVVLIAVLGLTAWLALRKRSRQWLFVLMIFSLLYFGFWRKGCICPIGSIQNVTLALFDSAYALPLSVVMFFFLPLLFALLFGRLFCAAACPLGAAQDLVVIKPVRVPATLALALGIIPYLYLGLAVLLAAGGAEFIICRFDPFVSFFRGSGTFSILVTGLVLLVAGMFIARPYCRFLCPYDVLLRWASRFSKWHVTITPDECIQCRLCEQACPFDAIRTPSTGHISEGREAAKRRLGLLAALFPVLILGGAWAGSKLEVPLERLSPAISLAWQVREAEAGAAGVPSLEAAAFAGAGRSVADLYREADALRQRFWTGSWWFGGFIGLVVACKLVALSTARRRNDYEPDRGACLSCGRCFRFCPREHVRLKKLGGV